MQTFYMQIYFEKRCWKKAHTAIPRAFVGSFKFAVQKNCLTKARQNSGNCKDSYVNHSSNNKITNFLLILFQTGREFILVLWNHFNTQSHVISYTLYQLSHTFCIITCASENPVEACAYTCNIFIQCTCARPLFYLHKY